MMAKRTGRRNSQLPECYHEGYLEKKPFKEKTPQKLWACLCGSTLFFFNNKRDGDYTEKLDLRGFISVTNDTSPDCNLDGAKFTLQMEESNVKLIAPSVESRELWKGFIQSVAELSVPSSLNLMPGQIHMLTVAVDKEKERITQVSSTTDTDGSHYLSLDSEMPTCYYPISRMEAQFLLEREAKRGNMLLRPGRDGTSFAVTTRQKIDRTIFRHYRVARNHEGGFNIAVENPVFCETLHDVVTYLVDKTDGILIPLIIEGYYEEKIRFVSSDNESGEKIEQTLADPLPPSLPFKPGSFANPEPATEEKLEKKDNETGELRVVPPPIPERKPMKKMTPPTPLPRKGIPLTSASSSSSTSTTNRDPGAPFNVDIQKQIPLGMMSELKLRLAQKAKE
ncbi:signal-transducing adaptor protein 1-like [Cololabis saira]|uniref:signal-transducing adaptor protein 1-like n=1 Tax=Cololabis saira TaxID=129043 RepID=UPI002AD4A71F|nr:signal-transducing adaptor protein 1-like [Cololabis saira]